MVEGEVKIVAGEVESDTHIQADKRTAELVQEIANSVCQYTTMEIDFPSNYQNNWMPILDHLVRIENRKVDWTFFKKPVDSKLFNVHPQQKCLVQQDQKSIAVTGSTEEAPQRETRQGR